MSVQEINQPIAQTPRHSMSNVIVNDNIDRELEKMASDIEGLPDFIGTVAIGGGVAEKPMPQLPKNAVRDGTDRSTEAAADKAFEAGKWEPWKQ